MNHMKMLLKGEEITEFLITIFVFNQLTLPWWMFLLFILAPDLGMLGYLFSNRIGAFCYNLLHFKALGILLALVGWYSSNEYAAFAGLIIFGHAALDRVFGYGLKYTTGFKYTHLGELN